MVLPQLPQPIGAIEPAQAKIDQHQVRWRLIQHIVQLDQVAGVDEFLGRAGAGQQAGKRLSDQGKSMGDHDAHLLSPTVVLEDGVGVAGPR